MHQDSTLAQSYRSSTVFSCVGYPDDGSTPVSPEISKVVHPKGRPGRPFRTRPSLLDQMHEFIVKLQVISRVKRSSLVERDEAVPMPCIELMHDLQGKFHTFVIFTDVWPNSGEFRVRAGGAAHGP